MSFFLLSKTLRRSAIALLCTLATACGGSGGGQSGSETKPVGFQVSVDRTAIRFEGEEGRAMQPVAVLGKGIGTLPGTIYTGSLDLSTSLGLVTTEVIGTQVKFTVHPKSNLPAGTYTGNLQLFACADEKCTQHFSGSPATVPYTITISKGFSVAPQSANLSAVSGSTITRDFNVSLPPSQTSFQASSSAAWLSITNLSNSGFSIKTSPMPPGYYSTIVSVYYPGRNFDIPVNFTVTGDSSTVSKIIADVSTINFNAIASATTPSTKKINLVLPSWSTESKAEISYPSSVGGWLTLNKIDERSYSVTAVAQNLVAGSYLAHLTIKSDPLTSPISIPVNFVVGAPTWTVFGSTDFLVDNETTTRQLFSELTIDLPALPAQAWTASTSATWIKLLNTSGTTGLNKLQATIDTTELIKMSNFSTHTAEIVITSANGKIAPKRVVFTLNKQLPEVNYVSPASLLPNEAGTVILRGRGFNRITNLEQGLSITGIPVKRITRINDTQLNLQFDGAAQGEANISLKNALSIPMGSASLKVLPQQSFSYRAIPVQGAKGSIYFDPERQSIYASNKALGTVMRFAASNNTWNITSANVPGIDAAAMSPDRKSLLTTSTNGNITLLDPNSLSTQASYTFANQISGDSLNSLPRLAMTSNGKAYFQSGFWSSELNYFDLVTRKFGSLKSDTTSFNFYSGPWFSISGDGDRLLVVQSGSITPSPPMLYLDSSDEAVKVNPVGIKFWYEAAQSLRGERFVEGTYKVWDRSFNLIGNIVLPGNSYYGRLPIFSPDGNRLYILSYHSSAFSGSNNSSNSSTNPRVYVLDTSQKLVTTTNLPVLGYFDISDYPTCSNSSYGCDTRPLGTISPDGKTLFFIGDKNLIVAPIPTLQQITPPAQIQQASEKNIAVPTNMTKHEIKK